MNDVSGKFDVGYRKPPREHQFRKGQSGNPKGRPRGAKGKPQVDTRVGSNAAEQFLRIEAYRQVTIREGDQLIELPAIQAVFRAMGVSAMEGNRFAQRTLAELVGNMEAEDYKSRLQLFGTAIDYKQYWEQEIERHRQTGRPEPQPLPHPADIILNTNTAEVRILGPQTTEQKAAYDKQIARRDEAQSEVTYYAERYRRARDPSRKAIWLEWWHSEQLIFDTIDDLLGPRYRVELKDRSRAPGASRKGDVARKHGVKF